MAAIDKQIQKLKRSLEEYGHLLPPSVEKEWIDVLHIIEDEVQQLGIRARYNKKRRD